MSSSFFKRARCKYCKGGPVDFYRSYSEEPVYKDTAEYLSRNMAWFRKHVKYVRTFNVYHPDLRDTAGISEYNSIVPPYYSYNTTFHRIIPYKMKDNKVMGFVELFFCDCSKTCWMFNVAKAYKDYRVDIVHRKADRAFYVIPPEVLW